MERLDQLVLVLRVHCSYVSSQNVPHMLDGVHVWGHSWPGVHEIHVVGGQVVLCASCTVGRGVVLLKDESRMIQKEWHHVELKYGSHISY